MVGETGLRLLNVLSHVAEVHRHSNGIVTIQYLLTVEIPVSEISRRLEHVIRKTVQVYVFIFRWEPVLLSFLDSN